MTRPRDPTEPTSDPIIDPPIDADPAIDADPNATARMPLPADPPQPAAPPAIAWTAPPPAPPSAASPAPPPASAAPPAWKPARTDDGRGPSIVVGLVLLAVGLWFFAEHTLGLDLPTLRWSQLWPVILIVIGVWVLFGARRRPR